MRARAIDNHLFIRWFLPAQNREIAAANRAETAVRPTSRPTWKIAAPRWSDQPLEITNFISAIRDGTAFAHAYVVTPIWTRLLGHAELRTAPRRNGRLPGHYAQPESGR